MKYIVSIGTQHDMQVNLWNWKSGSKVATNKLSSKVSILCELRSMFCREKSFYFTV